jgi:NAD(P)-dependent dehydrogenase (short-subunit alcohol dehydrogenase family)
MAEHQDLSGLVAIVTGASYGLGYAISEELARRGTAVLITDISERLIDAAATLTSKGYKVKATRVDVCDKSSVEAGVKAAVDAFGRLDILVANAAMPRSAKSVMEMDGTDWDATMAVNVRGALYCIQAAAAQMIAQGAGGRIITIGSTAGLKPYKRRSHYCTSKAAVIQLTRVAGLELAEHKITANCVCPGQTLTDNLKMMVTGGLNTDEGEEMRRRQAAIPLGPNDPIDIANAVAFFASPAARTVTGQVLAVEGGGLMTG